MTPPIIILRLPHAYDILSDCSSQYNLRLLYGRKLFILSNRILSNSADAEESASDTHTETWKTISPKKPQYFLFFWLQCAETYPSIG